MQQILFQNYNFVKNDSFILNQIPLTKSLYLLQKTTLTHNNLPSFMTLQEAEKRLNLIRLQLEIMRLYKDDLLKQFGSKGYDDRLNEVLDKFIYFSKLCRTLKN